MYTEYMAAVQTATTTTSRASVDAAKSVSVDDEEQPVLNSPLRPEQAIVGIKHPKKTSPPNDGDASTIGGGGGDNDADEKATNESSVEQQQGSGSAEQISKTTTVTPSTTSDSTVVVETTGTPTTSAPSSSSSSSSTSSAATTSSASTSSSSSSTAVTPSATSEAATSKATAAAAAAMTSRQRKYERKTKRFIWPDELHRLFVSAIFDVGLKNASPKALLAIMGTTGQTMGLTTEHLKSHLQKYRINYERSRQEFLQLYDQSIRRDLKRRRKHSLKPGGDSEDDVGRNLRLRSGSGASSASDVVPSSLFGLPLGSKRSPPVNSSGRGAATGAVENTDSSDEESDDEMEPSERTTTPRSRSTSSSRRGDSISLSKSSNDRGSHRSQSPRYGNSAYQHASPTSRAGHDSTSISVTPMEMTSAATAAAAAAAAAGLGHLAPQLLANPAASMALLQQFAMAANRQANNNPSIGGGGHLSRGAPERVATMDPSSGSHGSQSSGSQQRLGAALGLPPTNPIGGGEMQYDPQWNLLTTLMSPQLAAMGAPLNASLGGLPNATGQESMSGDPSRSIASAGQQESFSLNEEPSDLQFQMHMAMQAQMNLHRQMLMRKVEVAQRISSNTENNLSLQQQQQQRPNTSMLMTGQDTSTTSTSSAAMSSHHPRAWTQMGQQQLHHMPPHLQSSGIGINLATSQGPSATTPAMVTRASIMAPQKQARRDHQQLALYQQNQSQPQPHSQSLPQQRQHPPQSQPRHQQMRSPRRSSARRSMSQNGTIAVQDSSMASLPQGASSSMAAGPPTASIPNSFNQNANNNLGAAPGTGTGVGISIETHAQILENAPHSSNKQPEEMMASTSSSSAAPGMLMATEVSKTLMGPVGNTCSAPAPAVPSGGTSLDGEMDWDRLDWNMELEDDDLFGFLKA